MTSGTTLQLVTAMRGGPLNIRRVPMRDEGQWMRMQLASDSNLARDPRSHPVAVIVLQDGTQLHFFQYIDSNESLQIEPSDDESEIKSTDAEEVRERKEANIRTRATMASLRAKMEQVTRNKKAKAATGKRSPTKSPVGKPTNHSPTINGGSGTRLPGANIPIVIGRSAISATRSSTIQNEKKGTASGPNVTSSKRNGGSVEGQNRNDRVDSSLLDQEQSSSSILARLLQSSSELHRSSVSLRAANHASLPVDSRTSPTDESSLSSIWLRRVQGRDEVGRTSSGRLVAMDSKHSTRSNIIKGRANKNTAASGVINVQSPTSKIPDHCSHCSRRLRLGSSFQCRCGGTFCDQHRYPEAHRCPYDYKTKGRQVLDKDNPKVVAEKLPKM